MRSAVPINLASQPFRRDRPFVVGAVAGSTVLVALLVYQAAFIYIRHNEATEARAAVEQTRRQVQTLGAEQSRLDSLDEGQELVASAHVHDLQTRVRLLDLMHRHLAHFPELESRVVPRLHAPDEIAGVFVRYFWRARRDRLSSDLPRQVLCGHLPITVHQHNEGQLAFVFHHECLDNLMFGNAELTR